MTTYKHTQVGYPMLLVTIIIAGFFAWVYSTASAEPPSLDSGPNFAISAIMAGIVFILASFTTLSVSVDENYLHIRFGWGIFRRSFAVSDIASVECVKNRWYYGWGIRLWLWPTMWIYNIYGLHAVEIITRNGGRYRIGTDTPLELEAAIRKAAHM